MPMREEYLATGESDVLETKVSFEAMAQRRWEFEQPGLEVSNGKSLRAYTRAVENRLVSHHFSSRSSF